MRVISSYAKKAGPKIEGLVSRSPVWQRKGKGNIQPKLTVGAPNDIYEKEADHLADRVMRMTETIYPQQEEEENIRAKTISDDEPVVTPGIESGINSLKKGGQVLPEGIRAFFEPRFGADFSQVRVHTGPQASQSAQSIQAKAFTTGNHIVFNQGQYNPGTNAGKHLLAHELTHVVQQNQPIGRIQRFKMDKSDQKNYPRLTEYLRNRAPVLAYNPTITNALLKFGQVTKAVVRNHFIFGRGPLINVESLEGIYGRFIPIPHEDKFSIDDDLVLGLENASYNQTLNHLLLVGATIIHEYTHYADNLDNLDYEGEEGELLEIQIYKRRIDNIEDAKEVWKEYRQRHSKKSK